LKFKEKEELFIVKVVAITLFILFGLTTTVLTNPIPWPLPASMPLEDMKIQIQAMEGGLHAQFSGDFTFDYIPNEVYLMLFPVPPDATNIQVYQDEVEISWTWSSEKYTTILPEIPTIPMIDWEGPFPTEGCIFTVKYEHKLIERPDEFIFFYALGTGKYFQTYDKTTTAYFTITLPSTYKVNGVWLNDNPHDYSVFTLFNVTQLTIIVESSFGPITKDLIVSLVADSCFIQEIYEKNSEEIKVLRNYRDNVLNKTPEGQELIKLYYQWSPTIVEAMEEYEEFKKEVKEMIDGILLLIKEEVE